MICSIKLGTLTKIICQSSDDSLTLQKYSRLLKAKNNAMQDLRQESIISEYWNQLKSNTNFSIQPIELRTNLSYNSEESLSLNNNKINLDYSLIIGGELLNIPYQFELGSISTSSSKLNELNNINFNIDVPGFKDKLLSQFNSELESNKDLGKSELEELNSSQFDFRNVIERERHRVLNQQVEIENQLKTSNDSILIERRNQLIKYQENLDSIYSSHIRYKSTISDKINSVSTNSNKYKNQLIDKVIRYKDSTANRFEKLRNKLMLPLIKTTEKLNIGRQYANNSNLASKYQAIKGINYEGKIGSVGYKLILGTPGFRTNRLINTSNLRNSGFGISFKGSYKYLELNHSADENFKQSIYFQIVRRDSVYHRENNTYFSQNGIIGYCLESDLDAYGKIRLELSKSEITSNTKELLVKILKFDSNVISRLAFNANYELNLFKYLHPYFGIRWVGMNYESWANELLLSGMKEIRSGVKGSIKNHLNYDIGFSKINPSQKIENSNTRTFWNAMLAYRVSKSLRIMINARPGLVEYSNINITKNRSLQSFYSATLNYNGKFKKYIIQSILNYSNNKTSFEIQDTTNYNGSNYITLSNFLIVGKIRLGINSQLNEYEKRWNMIHGIEASLNNKNYYIKLGVQKGSNYDLWRKSYGSTLELGLNLSRHNFFISNQIMAPDNELVSRYLLQTNVGMSFNFQNIKKI